MLCCARVSDIEIQTLDVNFLATTNSTLGGGGNIYHADQDAVVTAAIPQLLAPRACRDAPVDSEQGTWM